MSAAASPVDILRARLTPTDIVFHLAAKRGVVQTRVDFDALNAVAIGQRVSIGALVDMLAREHALARYPGYVTSRASEIVRLAGMYGPASPAVMRTATVWARRREERR